MNNMKNSGFFRTISLVLIFSFILLDISWAYPSGENTQNNNLAIWSNFQQSIFAKEAGSALVIRSIANNIFGSPEESYQQIPLKHLDGVVEADLREMAKRAPEVIWAEGLKALKTIDVSHVATAKWEDGKFVEEELDKDKFVPQDAILLVPYRKDGMDRIIQIALKGSPNANALIGEEASFLLGERFVVMDVPRDWKGSTHAPAEAKETPKLTVSEPVATIEVPVAVSNKEKKIIVPGSFRAKEVVSAGDYAAVDESIDRLSVFSFVTGSAVPGLESLQFETFKLSEKYLVITTRDPDQEHRDLFVYDLKTGQRILRLGTTEPYYRVGNFEYEAAISGDNMMVTFRYKKQGMLYNDVDVYDIPSGKLLKEFQKYGEPNQIHYHLIGDVFVTDISSDEEPRAGEIKGRLVAYNVRTDPDVVIYDKEVRVISSGEWNKELYMAAGIQAPYISRYVRPKVEKRSDGTTEITVERAATAKTADLPQTPKKSFTIRAIITSLTTFLSLLIVMFFTSAMDIYAQGLGVPSAPSIVTTQAGDRRIFIRDRKQDGTLGLSRALTIKGVNWSPASTNSNPQTDPAAFRQEFFKWYTNDIPLMAEMGVNVARLYYDMGTNTQARDVLDMFYKYGIGVIMPVTAPYYGDTANSNNIVPVVTALRDHPAILGWGIGNEWDINYYYNTFTSLRKAAEFTERCAQIVAGLDTNHPPVSFYGDPHIAISDYYRYHYLDSDTAPWQPTDGTVNFTSITVNDWAPSVKVWGIQLYRNASFTDAFAQWGRVSTKPVFVSEFGADSYDHRIMGENQAMQRDFNVGLWDEVLFNLASERTNGIVLGVLAFEWVDEWYKGGNPGVHSYSTETNYGQPDGSPGYNDEKWFGLLTAQRTPKLTYYGMRDRFVLDGQNGVTPVTNPVFKVTSGNPAVFELNGKTVYNRAGGEKGGRGLNFAILDEKTGIRIKDFRHFDTWYYRYDAPFLQSVADYINAIPGGSIVAVAATDNIGIYNGQVASEPVFQAFEALGSTYVRTAPQTSWALIAKKGTGKLAETSTTSTITATPELTIDPDAGRRPGFAQVERLVIQGFKQTDENFQVTFKSQGGFVYQIDYRDDLTTGQWKLARRGIVADGTSTTWTDDGSFTGGNLRNIKKRFYRVTVIDRVVLTSYRDDTFTESEKPHDFTAESGHIAATITGISVIISIALAAVQYIPHGGFTGLTAAAALAGAYFAWATIRYLGMSNSAFDVLTKSGLTRNEVMTTAIARSDGYRHPAYVHNELIQLHEGFEHHWAGMLGVLPIISSFFRSKFEDSLRNERMYAKANSENPDDVFKVLVNDPAELQRVFAEERLKSQAKLVAVSASPLIETVKVDDRDNKLRGRNIFDKVEEGIITVERVYLDGALQEASGGAIKHLRDMAIGKYASVKKEKGSPIVATDIPPMSFGKGLKLNISYVDKKRWVNSNDKRHFNVCMVRYKNGEGNESDDYDLKVRGSSFYTEEHFIFGKEGKQKITSPYELEAFLGMTRVLGNTHEGIFNATAPIRDQFHAQYIQRKMTIWDNREKWPALTEYVEGADIAQTAAEAFTILNQYSAQGIKCDLAFRYDNSVYKLIIFPRINEIDKNGRPVPKGKPSSFTGIRKSDFGVLEMGGYMPLEDTEDNRNAIAFLKANPSLYTEALTELSMPYEYIYPVKKFRGAEALEKLTPAGEKSVKGAIEEMLDLYGHDDPSKGGVMRYPLKSFTEYPAQLPGGEKVGVWVFPGRPGRRSADKYPVPLVIDYRGVRYTVAIHRLPYGKKHIVLGKLAAGESQTISGPEKIELILRTAKMLGKDYEGFFNGVGAGNLQFHAQFLEKCTPLWTTENHIKLLQSHMNGIKSFKGVKAADLAKEIYKAWNGYNIDDIKSDLLVHFDGQELICYVVPRANERPNTVFNETVKDATGKTVKDTEGKDKYIIGSFGCLEIAGRLMNHKTEKAALGFQAHPDNYTAALKEMSIPKHPEVLLSVAKYLLNCKFTDKTGKELKKKLINDFVKGKKEEEYGPHLRIISGMYFDGVTYNTESGVFSIPYARITVPSKRIGSLDLNDTRYVIKISGTKDSPKIDTIEEPEPLLPPEADDDFSKLCEDATGKLVKEDVQEGKVVDLRGTEHGRKEVIVLGDLHGNYANLEAILKNGVEKKIEDGEAILLITGDAIHPAIQGIRGFSGKEPHDKISEISETADSIKTLMKIMDLKIKNPANVYYIMGNHDAPYYFRTTKPIHQNTQFQNAILARYGQKARELYIKFLDQSPLVFISDKLVAVHGGPVKGKALTLAGDKLLDLLKGKSTSELGIDDPEGLLSLQLKDIDPGELGSSGITDSDVSVVTQIILNMRRFYAPVNKNLLYEGADVAKFLKALGMPEDTNFLIGHDHDLDRGKDEHGGVVKKIQEQGEASYINNYRPVLEDHGFYALTDKIPGGFGSVYCLFSGGHIEGYVSFRGGAIVPQPLCYIQELAAKRFGNNVLAAENTVVSGNKANIDFTENAEGNTVYATDDGTKIFIHGARDLIVAYEKRNNLLVVLPLADSARAGEIVTKLGEKSPYITGDNPPEMCKVLLGSEDNENNFYAGEVALIETGNTSAFTNKGMIATINIRDHTIIWDRLTSEIHIYKGSRPELVDEALKRLSAQLTKENTDAFKSPESTFKGGLRGKSLTGVFTGVIEAQEKDGTAPKPLRDGRPYWSEGVLSSGIAEGSGVYKAFNAGRNLGTRETARRNCLLCASQRNERGIIVGDRWEAKANSYPIFGQHGIVICREHAAQSLTGEDIEDVLGWLEQSPDIKFFYNGMHAGATEPAHKHIQYFVDTKPYGEIHTPLNGRMPTEAFFEKGAKTLKYSRNNVDIYTLDGFPSKEKPIALFVLESDIKNKDMLKGELVAMTEKMAGSGMDYDVMWTASGNKIRAFVTPRTKERVVSNEQYKRLKGENKRWATPTDREILLTKRVDGRVLASVEFGGIFVGVDKDQYEKISREDFEFALNALGLPAGSEGAKKLVADLLLVPYRVEAKDGLKILKSRDARLMKQEYDLERQAIASGTEESILELILEKARALEGFIGSVDKESHLNRLIDAVRAAKGKNRGQYYVLDRLMGLREDPQVEIHDPALNIEQVYSRYIGEGGIPLRYKDAVFLPKSGTVYVIGDTHGDSTSTADIIKKIDFEKRIEKREKIFLVFSGDYINNGLDNIKNLMLVLTLKERFPDNVVLLSGNHEFNESYATVVKEYYKTHWDNSTKNTFSDKNPTESKHYDHIRLELIKKFGVEAGEKLYQKFAEWGRKLPYACFTGSGIMISHSMGLPKEEEGVVKTLTLGGIAGAKEDAEDTAQFELLGYEGWKKFGTTTHARMVNGREITTGLLDRFTQGLGVQKFIVGHTHFRSGHVEHDGRLVTLCSSDMNSLYAGHYMYQEMRVAAKKEGYEESNPFYLEIDLSNRQVDLEKSKRNVSIGTTHAIAEEAVQSEILKTHDFTASSGYNAAAVTSAVSLASFAAAVGQYITQGDFTGVTIAAVLAGAYFGWAAVRYFGMGKSVSDALVMIGMARDEALTTAIARNDGYRHPAYVENRFITLHEGFEHHWTGMLGVLPIIGWFGGYEESLRRADMYAKANSDNPDDIFKAAISGLSNIRKMAIQNISTLKDAEKLEILLELSFNSDEEIKNITLNELFEMNIPQALVNNSAELQKVFMQKRIEIAQKEISSKVNSYTHNNGASVNAPTSTMLSDDQYNKLISMFKDLVALHGLERAEAIIPEIVKVNYVPETYNDDGGYQVNYMTGKYQSMSASISAPMEFSISVDFERLSRLLAEESAKQSKSEVGPAVAPASQAAISEENSQGALAKARLMQKIARYDKRIPLAEEPVSERKKLAEQLRNFIIDFDSAVNANHEYGTPFNERGLRDSFRKQSGVDYEVKIRRGGQGLPIDDKDFVSVRAAWIDELGISVIILDYEAQRGTRVTSDFAMAYKYETLSTETLISDNNDPLVKMVENSGQKSHAFSASYGYDAALFTGVISGVSFAGAILEYILQGGHFNSLPIPAIVSGVYFAWATLRYYGMSHTAIKALMKSGLDRDEAIYTLIARNDGYRHPAYVHNDLIQLHEGFEQHWTGMIGVMPIISWFFRSKFENSLRRAEMYAKSKSDNPEHLFEAAMAGFADIRSIAVQNVSTLNDMKKAARLLELSFNSDNEIKEMMLNILFSAKTAEALNVLREAVARSMVYNDRGVYAVPIDISIKLSAQISSRMDMDVLKQIVQMYSELEEIIVTPAVTHTEYDQYLPQPGASKNSPREDYEATDVPAAYRYVPNFSKLEALIKDPTEFQRVFVERSIELRASRLIKLIEKLGNRYNHKDVHGTTVDGLEKLATLRAVEILANIANSNKGSNDLASDQYHAYNDAMNTLIRIGSPAVPYLIKSLGSENNSHHIGFAALALMTINDPRLSFMSGYLQTVRRGTPMNSYVDLTNEDIAYILGCLERGIKINAEYVPCVTHVETQNITPRSDVDGDDSDAYFGVYSWKTPSRSSGRQVSSGSILYSYDVLDSPARLIFDMNKTRPESLDVEKVRQLFEIVESALNNNRARLVNAGNELVTFLAERDELPAEAGLLLVLGSDDLEVARGAAELYKSQKTKFKYVMCSGKGKDETPEGQKFTEEMIANGVPRGAFLLPETNSRFMGENLSFTAKQLAEAGKLGEIKSVVVVQTPLYNRQAKAAIGKNFVTEEGKVATQTGYVYAPSVPKMDTEKTALELKEQMGQVLAAADNLKTFGDKGWIDKTELPADVSFAAQKIREGLSQLDADSIVTSLIVMARRAKDPKNENQKLIVGISTDWIPAYKDEHSFQYQATNSLVNKIKALPQALKSMGLDNVELVIEENSSTLASNVSKIAQDSNARLSNVVVIASRESVEGGVFDKLRDEKGGEKALLAGMDSKELMELYKVNGEISDKVLDIDIMEILALTLEVATGKMPPRKLLAAPYDSAKRILILSPGATIKDYQKLRDINEGRKQALQAA